MAEQLESLAHHYDNMSNALHDFEAGEEFGEEDIQGRQCNVQLVVYWRLTLVTGMNEDTAALPVIISELDDGIESISRLQYALCHERAYSI